MSKPLFRGDRKTQLIYSNSYSDRGGFLSPCDGSSLPIFRKVVVFSRPPIFSPKMSVLCQKYVNDDHLPGFCARTWFIVFLRADLLDFNTPQTYATSHNPNTPADLLDFPKP